MTTQSPEQRQSSGLPPVLQIFLLSAVVLWVACIGAEAFCRFVLHFRDFHYVRLTLVKTDDYADVTMFTPRFRHFHSPAFFDAQLGSHFLYPAPAAFFYWIGLRLLGGSKQLFFCMLLGGAAAGVWFFRALQRQGLDRKAAAVFATGAVVTSYPLYVEINRGNIEIFIWLLAAGGVLALLRGKPWLAAVLIGIAGACKGYPFLYLALFLPLRKYAQAALGIVVGVAVNLFSLWAITGNFALGKAGVTAGLEEFRQNYVLSYNAVGLDHSFFGFYKRVVPVLPSKESLAHGLNLYLAVAGVLALLVYFVWVIRLPLLNQLLFLTAMAITLPPTSYDYTLVHLYTGFAVLVFVAVRVWKNHKPDPRGLWAAFGCYAILLTPQNEVIFHGDRLEGQIKCLALLALAIVAIRYPLLETEDSDLPTV